MGIIDLMILTVFSIGWGAVWFKIGSRFRKQSPQYDGAGLFLQVFGSIFIAGPVVMIAFAVSAAVLLTMTALVKGVLLLFFSAI